MNRFCWLHVALFSLNALIVNAQFDKANDHYQAKQYAAAIPLFEAGLLEKNNLAARTRLANCYRLTNKMDKAEALFAEIVAQPKAKSEAFLHYAEALMSNGKYAEAKTFFLQFAALEPDDSTGQRMARNCDLVPGLAPFFPFASVEELPFNSESDDNSALFWRGGLVFTSDRPGGPALLKKKAGWTGRDYLKLWWVKYDGAGQFGEPKTFSGRLNELNKNTANASFSADGKQVFFTRNGEFSGRDNTLNLQLYSAENTGGARWKNEEKLPFCTPEVNWMHPAISPDGSWLAFSSNKSGSLGGFDLWFSRRNGNGSWAKPQNFGPEINTSASEGFPFIDAKGRLFFCSKGHPGFGGFDIFVSNFDSISSAWSRPVNLGKPVNGSRDDLGFSIAPNDSIGLFTSSRNGDDDDVFLFWQGSKKELPQASAAETADVEQAISESQAVENQLNEINFGPFHLDSLGLFLTENRLAEGQIFSLPEIRFDSAQAIEPTAESAATMERLRILLATFPFLKIEIGAHIEAFSKEKVCQKMGEFRVNVLLKKLTDAGVPKTQIDTRSFGSRQPVVACPLMGECPPGLLLANRRVEIKVLAAR